MSSPNRRPLSNRAARRADILLALADAAAESVGEGTTFADLSVERLARRAGISRASFYLYFEDKGQLVRAWHDSLAARLDDIFAAWWEANPPTREVISSVIARLAAAYSDERFVVAALQAMSAHDPALRAALSDAFEQRVSALRKHMLRGQRAGWIDDDLTAATTAPWLVAMIDRVMQQVVPNTEVDSALIDSGTDVIWHTLYST